jgi:hypothetical protein
MQPKTFCKICGGPNIGRGWCRAHYKRWYKYGDPLGKYEKKPPRFCTVENCAKPERARGFCTMHYARQRIYGSLDLPVRTPKFGPDCTAPNCDNRAHSGGLCHKHYFRLIKHGRLDDPVPKVPKSRRRTVKVAGRHRKRAQIIAEAKIGRPMAPNEVAHHIDHNPANDAPENIQVLTKAEHQRLHNFQRYGNTEAHKRCPRCNEVKPRSEFREREYCPPCYRAYWRDWYAKQRLHP